MLNIDKINSIEELEGIIYFYNAKSFIKSFSIPVDINIDNFRYFSTFNKDKRDLILKTLIEEGKEYELADFVFKFKRLPIYKLPSSAWEDPIEQAKKHNMDAMEFSVYHFNKIRELEFSILEGYDKNKPILIEASIIHSQFHYAVRGGNHRLQACRNLIDKDLLPRDFRIPSIIMMHYLFKMLRKMQEINVIKRRKARPKEEPSN
ncbi:MAG: hypothetical protein ACFFCS_22830 [Candidatus Hodarchaeota archaeon]